jgi:hypothetical protein
VEYFVLNKFKIGREFEDEIFEALRKATKEIHATNTVVLSGLKLKEANFQDESGEIDFLIVSLPLKSIIHIEAKKGNSNSNRRKASAQLKRGMTFFEEIFPFPVSEKWNYIKMMCFGESVQRHICDHCKPFVLSANFLSEKKTQPVAEQIADQFRTFWERCNVHKGTKLKNFLSYSFLHNLLRHFNSKNYFLVSI